MNKNILGLHHITAIAGNAQQNPDIVRVCNADVKHN